MWIACDGLSEKVLADSWSSVNGNAQRQCFVAYAAASATAATEIEHRINLQEFLQLNFFFALSVLNHASS